jgi:hypothetical protein
MQTNNKENSILKPVILFADDDEICLDVGVCQGRAETVLNWAV